MESFSRSHSTKTAEVRLDCLDDAAMSAAAAKISAHAFAQLVVRELDRCRRKIAGDGARHPALDLACHSDRRTDLTRGAISALETVMLDEGPLQWMQRAIASQPLDGGDL